jgi:hypothetical protein
MKLIERENSLAAMHDAPVEIYGVISTGILFKRGS